MTSNGIEKYLANQNSSSLPNRKDGDMYGEHHGQLTEEREGVDVLADGAVATHQAEEDQREVERGPEHEQQSGPIAVVPGRLRRLTAADPRWRQGEGRLPDDVIGETEMRKWAEDRLARREKPLERIQEVDHAPDYGPC